MSWKHTHTADDGVTVHTNPDDPREIAVVPPGLQWDAGIWLKAPVPGPPALILGRPVHLVHWVECPEDTVEAVIARLEQEALLTTSASLANELRHTHQGQAYRLDRLDAQVDTQGARLTRLEGELGILKQLRAGTDCLFEEGDDNADNEPTPVRLIHALLNGPVSYYQESKAGGGTWQRTTLAVRPGRYLHDGVAVEELRGQHVLLVNLETALTRGVISEHPEFGRGRYSNRRAGPILREAPGYRGRDFRQSWRKNRWHVVDLEPYGLSDGGVGRPGWRKDEGIARWTKLMAHDTGVWLLVVEQLENSVRPWFDVGFNGPAKVLGGDRPYFAVDQGLELLTVAAAAVEGAWALAVENGDVDAMFMGTK